MKLFVACLENKSDVLVKKWCIFTVMYKQGWILLKSSTKEELMIEIDLRWPDRYFYPATRKDIEYVFDRYKMIDLHEIRNVDVSNDEFFNMIRDSMRKR